MIREMMKIMWVALSRRLVIVPVTATGLAIWVSPFISPDDAVPVRWLLIAAPITFWLIFEPLHQAAKLQLQANIDPNPDISLRYAFQHVMLHSKVALATDPDDENFYTGIESRLRDAARRGRLNVWARHVSNHLVGFRETLFPIEKDHWDALKIDLPSCIYDDKTNAELQDYGHSSTQYLEDAQVNKRQVIGEWPKASWWARFRDPLYKRRLQFFEQKRRGPVIQSE